MKNLVLTLTILIIHLKGFSQTNVSGFMTTNTVWDTLNDPYIVTGNVLVTDSVKLTILPGTVVKFNSQKTLQIDGELNAIGSDSSRITFTANSSNPSAGYWDAIILSSSSKPSLYDSLGNYVSGNVIRNADLEYGGYIHSGNTYSGTIECYNSTLLLEKCLFSNSASEAIWFYGNSSSGASVVSENTLYSCGIKYQQHGNPKKILANYINNGDIWILNYSGNAIIRENIIKNPELIAIRSHTSDYTQILNNIILNSNVLRSGIYQNKYTNQNSYTIYGNLIIGNCYNSFASNISNNLFIGNSNPIISDTYNSYLSTYSKNQFIECVNYSLNDTEPMIKIDGAGYGASYKFSNNLFENNIVATNMGIIQHKNNYNLYVSLDNNNFIENQGTYLVKNLNTSINIPATNNYWGTTNTNNIDLLIYDWFDNPTKSYVLYSPILTSLDTTTPISRPKGIKLVEACSGSIALWNSNLEADIKGYKIHYGDFNGYEFEYIMDLGDTNIFDTQFLSAYDTIAITAYDNLADGINDLIEGHESWFRFIDLNSSVIQLDLSSLNSNNFQWGDTVQLVVDSNYTSYLWSTSDTTNSIFVTSPGVYSLIATDSNGISYCDTVTISLASGITENSLRKFIAIYPNPTSSKLSIKSNTLTIEEINIIDFTGKKLKTITQNFDEINVIDLLSGIYFIQITTEKGTLSEKFVKQ